MLSSSCTRRFSAAATRQSDRGLRQRGHRRPGGTRVPADLAVRTAQMGLPGNGLSCGILAVGRYPQDAAAGVVQVLGASAGSSLTGADIKHAIGPEPNPPAVVVSCRRQTINQHFLAGTAPPTSRNRLTRLTDWSPFFAVYMTYTQGCSGNCGWRATPNRPRSRVSAFTLGRTAHGISGRACHSRSRHGSGRAFRSGRAAYRERTADPRPRPDHREMFQPSHRAAE